MKRTFLMLLFIFCSLQYEALASETAAQATVEELEQTIRSLQIRVNQLEMSQSNNTRNVTKERDSIAAIVALIGIFCAWWAKTTGRNAFVWFVLGVLFHFITAIVVIFKTEPGVKRF